MGWDNEAPVGLRFTVIAAHYCGCEVCCGEQDGPAELMETDDLREAVNEFKNSRHCEIQDSYDNDSSQWFTSSGMSWQDTSCGEPALARISFHCSEDVSLSTVKRIHRYLSRR